MRDSKQDMSGRKLPACWECGLPVQSGAIILVSEGGHLDSKEFPPGFYPAVWRYCHATPECNKRGDRPLDGRLPQTYVAWIQMTLRLLQTKDSWFLFEMTNWSWVLDCVQQDYVQGLNEYENPKPKMAKRREVVAPPPRKLIIKKKPTTPAKKIIRRSRGTTQSR